MTLATGIVLATSILLFPGRENVLADIESHITPTLFVVLVGAALLGALVKGTVGFGAGLIPTPIFATVMDPTVAVVVLAILPWQINMFQIGETQTGVTYVREEWPLVGLAIVGTVLGVYFLSAFSAGAGIRFLMGMFILAYASYELLTGFITIEGARHGGALAMVGLVEGFLVAAVNMGGILPAYLHTFERDTERYIGGLSVVYTLAMSVRLVVLYSTDLLTFYRLWLGSVIATAGIGGLLLGTFLRRLRLDQTRFDRLVIALLFIIGLNLLRKTIPDLFL
jgi:uncharacterized membrane protein YfcA